MDDGKMISDGEARGCGDGGCVFRAPSDKGQHTNAGCRCLPLRMTPSKRVGLREQIRALVVALDEAHARAEQAERERDEARAFLDAEINANVRWAAQAEHDLLRRLWQRIDGEQEGDAPSAVEMEDGLVRLFDDMRADVERCAADENASTEEADRLSEALDDTKAERDRLARLATQANTDRASVAKLTAARDEIGAQDFATVLDGYKADAAAASDLIAAQEDQIRHLTQMLRALGHYAPSKGFTA